MSNNDSPQTNPDPEEPGFSVRNELLHDDSFSMIYRGFRITFANGYTVSVLFGTVDCCSVCNANIPADPKAAKKMQDAVCPEAEVAVIAPDGRFLDFKGGNSARGYTDPDTLAKIMAWAAGLSELSENTTYKEV